MQQCTADAPTREDIRIVDLPDDWPLVYWRFPLDGLRERILLSARIPEEALAVVLAVMTDPLPYDLDECIEVAIAIVEDVPLGPKDPGVLAEEDALSVIHERMEKASSEGLLDELHRLGDEYRALCDSRPRRHYPLPAPARLTKKLLRRVTEAVERYKAAAADGGQA